MTSVDNQPFFREVVDLGECGLDMADELVRQAARRLDIILRSTPSTASLTSPKEEYPFPLMPKAALAISPHKARTLQGHSRMSSMASTKSNMSVASSRLLPSMKSTASLASMTNIEDEVSLPFQPSRSATNKSLAMDSLRRIRATSARPAEVVSNPRWPSLSGWSLKSPPLTARQTTDSERTPLLRASEPPAASQTLKHKVSGSLPPARVPSPSCIRSIASSPNVGGDRLVALQATERSGQSTPRRRLPFEPSDADSINTTIDPELAAAELRSALTKQVVCGVCCTKGVNFPECRKCGLTFCSRACRVDAKKGGDGKKWVHLPCTVEMISG